MGLPVTESIAALHHAKEKFRKAFLKKVGPVDASDHATVLETWKHLPCRKLMEGLRKKMVDYQEKHFPKDISHPLGGLIFKKDLTSPKADLDFLFARDDDSAQPPPDVITLKLPSSTADLSPDLAGKISGTIYCEAATLYRMSEFMVQHRAESPSCNLATNVVRTVGTSLGHQIVLNECSVCQMVVHAPATPTVEITLPDGTTKKSSPTLMTALGSGLLSGLTATSVMRLTADLGMGSATPKVMDTLCHITTKFVGFLLLNG